MEKGKKVTTPDLGEALKVVSKQAGLLSSQSSNQEILSTEQQPLTPKINPPSTKPRATLDPSAPHMVIEEDTESEKKQKTTVPSA